MLKLKSLFILLFSIFASFLFLLPLSQTEANITTGLVSHWKMDETTGTTASDSAGTNTGTLINSPTWTTGKLNNALSFDGINDYTNISNERTFKCISFYQNIGVWNINNVESVGYMFFTKEQFNFHINNWAINSPTIYTKFIE